MRTTLEIDDDVYLHARERAGLERIPIGRVVSALMRQGLGQGVVPGVANGHGTDAATVLAQAEGFSWVNGFPVVRSPAQSLRVVSTALIEQIRESEGI